MNGSNLVDKMGVLYKKKLLYIKMSHLTYYQKTRDVILNRAKDYYENDKERLKEQARDKYRNLTEEKNKKNKGGIDIAMSEKKKKKLKEYQKNYHQAEKSI